MTEVETPPSDHVPETDERILLAPLPRLLLTDREAAAACGVSRNHFLGLVRAGRIQVTVIHLGRCVRYTLPSLQRWCESLGREAKA